jgi:type II secretory pathway pseudopilin PulG
MNLPIAMPSNNFVMNSEKPSSSKSRSGFSLVEVTLALGIVGMAILSLVGILGATFQQADEIMQTNRALAAATRLIGAFDNPRSIVCLNGDSNNPYNPPIKTTPSTSIKNYISGNSSTKFSNFDLSYNLLRTATNSNNAIWFYVYDRKLSVGDAEFTQDSSGARTYNIYSNPTVTEVALASDSDKFSPTFASTMNVVGNPMRVRVTLSRLLVGQRCEIDGTTFEPTTKTWSWTASGLDNLPSSVVPPSSKYYALAYLPVVAEFFPHDWSSMSEFKNSEQTPVLVQTIVISR